MKWTKDQINMLKSDMTNQEIAEATGRSVGAVEKSRYYYTGHSVEISKAILDTSEAKLFRAEGEARRVAKEKRIIDLCKMLHVRIGGMV